MVSLQVLLLHGNQLQTLGLEMGQFTDLQALELMGTLGPGTGQFAIFEAIAHAWFGELFTIKIAEWMNHWTNCGVADRNNPLSDGTVPLPDLPCCRA